MRMILLEGNISHHCDVRVVTHRVYVLCAEMEMDKVSRSPLYSKFAPEYLQIFLQCK